ncbi:MAG: GNAT family N-acetyltransferase [Treponema sp.]|jgi:GNAT superfamily N-acetyltransferase|nr:GNAT family N-acetyltransferase [Treponema sp.]
MGWRESNKDAVLRDAGVEDIPLILEFIRGLAEYEHLSEQVSATEHDLAKYLFTDRAAEVLICEYQGKPAGFALYFRSFSTFLGKPGIYIEDLFVKPEWRGRGLGGALFARIAAIAEERGCGRLEWSCLDWNEPSITFYKTKGGRALDEWTTYRLDRDALKKLAKTAISVGTGSERP